MDRDSAVTKLEPYPIYTFLVRCRVQNGERLGYALSLKTDQDVKHMKIDSAPASRNIRCEKFYESRLVCSPVLNIIVVKMPELSERA